MKGVEQLCKRAEGALEAKKRKTEVTEEEESDEYDWNFLPEKRVEPEVSGRERQVEIMRNTTKNLGPKVKDVVYLADIWKDMTVEDWRTWEGYSRALKDRRARQLPEKEGHKLFGKIRAA